MLRIFLVYALSGFVSLGYQVAWFRIFTDWFGSTNLTFALVVVNFIGGLGAGALLSQRLAGSLQRISRLDDKLRLYGLIELLISAAALLTIAAAFIPADLWGSFPYHLVDGIWVQNTGYRFGQVIVATLCVFIPCLLMGVTFPLLCNTWVAEPGGARFPAALYAFNTLGACTGVLASQFLFLPWVGHGLTFQAMIGLNVLIGAWFLLTGGAPASDVVPQGAAKSGSDRDFGAPRSKLRSDPDLRRRRKGRAPPLGTPTATLLLLATLSGLLAGALEGDMFKRITFVVAGNPGALMPFISFWAIVAIFLGAFTVHHWKTLQLWHLKLAAVLSALSYYLAWRAMYPLSSALDRAQPRTEEAQLFTSSPMFPASTFELWWFTGVLVFVPFFFIALLLPWACNQLQASRRHLGLAYGLNTVAFCIGLISFTLLAPMLSIFYSLKLMFVLLACGIALLLLLSARRPFAIWQPAAVGGVFVAAALLTPARFDPAMMRPDTDPARLPVEYVMSDGANTTLVVRKPGDDRLYFGNMSMSGTNMLAQSYMRLMAHFPLLLQEAPERALLICFGVGNTASAIAAHDSIRQLDIVDINRNVFATAPAFAATHDNVQLDPRVRLINNDGRNFLRHTDESYDLVTSEPPPPMAAGVYRLYSREYYEDIRARLTPTGMMSQWLPVYQMPLEAVELAIASFVEVFPNAILYVGIQHELLLIGGRGEIDLERAVARFGQSDRVRADLAAIGVRDATYLIARIMMGDEALRERYAGRRQLSDQHNQLDQLFLTSDNLALLPYDPLAVRDYIAAHSPALAEEVGPVITHLGRLRYRVDSFPLQRVRRDPAITLSEVDWLRIARYQRTAARREAAGDRPGAIEVIVEALDYTPEQPALITWLTARLEASGRAGEGLPYLRTQLRLEPDDELAHWRMASALFVTGRASQAIPHLERAIEINPDWFSPFNNLAWIYAVHPDDGVRNSRRALELAERAAELSGYEDPGVLYTLGAAQAAAGRFDDAVSTAERAIRLAGNSPVADQLRNHLSLYERQQALIDPTM